MIIKGFYDVLFNGEIATFAWVHKLGPVMNGKYSGFIAGSPTLSSVSLLVADVNSINQRKLQRMCKRALRFVKRKLKVPASTFRIVPSGDNCNPALGS